MPHTSRDVSVPQRRKRISMYHERYAPSLVETPDWRRSTLLKARFDQVANESRLPQAAGIPGAVHAAAQKTDFTTTQTKFSGKMHIDAPLGQNVEARLESCSDAHSSLYCSRKLASREIVCVVPSCVLNVVDRCGCVCLRFGSWRSASTPGGKSLSIAAFAMALEIFEDSLS